MKITVIGCGRWGSLITWYLDRINPDFKVTLYGRPDSVHMKKFIQTRRNDLLELEKSVELSTDISCVNDADVIIISIGSQALRGLMGEIASLRLKDKIFVLCMKGIEVESGKLLTEIAEEYLDQSNKIAVWLGPGHVQEFYHGIPNCMVIDSKDADVKDMLVKNFSSELIRFYYGEDIIGNQIGAAAKNVIGIAAGMLDGIGLSTLKGALMSRGTREVARLIVAMGGSELSAYGLCHLGDYEATVFSQFSHNRKYGEMFVRGEKYDELAEGYHTVRAIVFLCERYNVEMPICQAVYRILYENANVESVFGELFKRKITGEFTK